MFDEETPYDTRFDDAPDDYAEPSTATGPGSDQSAGPPVGPDHLPPRPGVSLIDAGLGAGYLVTRIAAGPARMAARAGQRLTPPARRVLRSAPTHHGLTDLSAWVLRTLAQVGAPQRSRAERRVLVLARAATGAIASNRNVSRLVHDIASRQVAPLVDEALPIVLGRLAEQPEEVRKVVQGQSRGMMAEARDTARTGARHGDDMVDSMVDRLLRRRTPAAQAAPIHAAPTPTPPAQAASPAQAPPAQATPVNTAPVHGTPVHTAPTPTGPAQARGPGR